MAVILVPFEHDLSRRSDSSCSSIKNCMTEEMPGMVRCCNGFIFCLFVLSMCFYSITCSVKSHFDTNVLHGGSRLCKKVMTSENIFTINLKYEKHICSCFCGN